MPGSGHEGRAAVKLLSADPRPQPPRQRTAVFLAAWQHPGVPAHPETLRKRCGLATGPNWNAAASEPLGTRHPGELKPESFFDAQPCQKIHLSPGRGGHRRRYSCGVQQRRQARGLYAPVGVGMVGALALGPMAAEASAPRYARVVEHRYARKKNGKLHYCGCVVRHVRVY